MVKQWVPATHWPYFSQDPFGDCKEKKKKEERDKSQSTHEQLEARTLVFDQYVSNIGQKK